MYATSASTPLFFAQAVGRFVRARRPGETASVFLPSVPLLLRLAGELEADATTSWAAAPAPRRRLGRRPAGRRAGAAGTARARRSAPSPRSARRADLDQVLFDGASFGTAATPGTAEEEDYLGLPGLLEPDQVAQLLRQRQARAAGRGQAARAGAARRGRSRRGARAAVRAAQGAQRAWSPRTTTAPAGRTAIHTELRRACGGPPTAVASVEQLEQRIATLQSW